MKTLRWPYDDRYLPVQKSRLSKTEQDPKQVEFELYRKELNVGAAPIVKDWMSVSSPRSRDHSASSYDANMQLYI